MLLDTCDGDGEGAGAATKSSYHSGQEFGSALLDTFRPLLILISPPAEYPGTDKTNTVQPAGLPAAHVTAHVTARLEVRVRVRMLLQVWRWSQRHCCA